MKYLYLSLLALFMVLDNVKSQVTVEAKLDSAQIFIGQHVGITLQVSADKGKRVELPVFDSLQHLVNGIEVLEAIELDSVPINDGKRVMFSRKYLLTSFDTALYYIPPIKVMVDDKEYESKSLALKVYTYDIDTVHVDSIFGMNPEMSPPFEWEDWDYLLWLALVVFIITILLVYIAIRLKDNKPIIKRIRVKPQVAPHKVAMQKIEQIKEDKIWQKEDSKEYYTLLTDALRQYIYERYGFNAMEMTSFEIIQKLSEVNDEEALFELKELFQTADLVKFAKYNTLINENDRNLVSAIEYINQTKIEEEVKQQPEEIVVVEKSSKKTKMILVVSVCAVAIILIGLVSYMIYRISFLTI